MSQKRRIFIILMSFCLYVSIKMYTFAPIYLTRKNKE